MAACSPSGSGPLRRPCHNRWARSKSPSLLRRPVMTTTQQTYVPVSAWGELEAGKAFRKASRARRRAAIAARLRRTRLPSLAVVDETRRTGSRSGRDVREIPLDAIKGTTEPNRAAQFDEDFRPTTLTRRRWQSIWLAF